LKLAFSTGKLPLCSKQALEGEREIILSDNKQHGKFRDKGTGIGHRVSGKRLRVRGVSFGGKKRGPISLKRGPKTNDENPEEKKEKIHVQNTPLENGKVQHGYRNTADARPAGVSPKDFERMNTRGENQHTHFHSRRKGRKLKKGWGYRRSAPGEGAHFAKRALARVFMVRG